ncbi:hypothetical protein BDK51DRAFT_37428 [Blyttiomyces helicus]|uniref:F-box domain-containing protein n=1 Tax=Blyttiomyces helicus TaxID=388810 RepID=A0A4P9W090_9FUNG|nr:hypothetical protein BDK51DRAFT_37428 [Blyttiomyces helicus]|eukprot:RKO85529.1 hypothetical protein BDK51DRAFT_37428 [Blyttiomyces helicus]
MNEGTPVELNDSRQTNQLCATLLPSSLRRTEPEVRDPNIVNALAACTRYLTLNALPAAMTAGSTPYREPTAVGTDITATSPRARWSHLPVELLHPIVRLLRAAEQEQWRVYGYDRRLSAHARAARDIYACSLVCRTWEPVASGVLREWVVVTSDEMFLKLAFSSVCSSLRLGLAKERALVPQLENSSRVVYPQASDDCDPVGRGQNQADLAEITSTIARLEFVRMPMPSRTQHLSLCAAKGPALRFWAPESCRFPEHMPMTSLPNLECVELRAVTAAFTSSLPFTLRSAA